MRRREIPAVVGGAALGLLAASARPAPAFDDPKDDGDHAAHKAHARCVKACGECAEECLKAYRHCFAMLAKGDAKHAPSARMAADCAKFCALSLDLMLTGGPLMKQACAACAEACKACAEECAKVGGEEMKKCAAVCLDCEKACREMVRSMDRT